MSGAILFGLVTAIGVAARTQSDGSAHAHNPTDVANEKGESGRLPFDVSVDAHRLVNVELDNLDGISLHWANGPAAPSRSHLALMLWFERKRVVTGKRRRYRLPWDLERFQYEFLLDVVRMAKEFYVSFEGEKDRSYGTIGQYMASYRRALYPRPDGFWQQRLAVAAHLYKLGTSSYRHSHLFQGGWAALEFDLYPLSEEDHRILLSLAPLGLMREKLRDRQVGIHSKTWWAEMVVGAEALWRLKWGTPVIFAYWMPRWGRIYSHRIHSELAFRLHVHVDESVRGWFQSVTIVPKIMYLYTSRPWVVVPRLSREEAREFFFSMLPWTRLKDNVTFYVQVVMRLAK
ncbi:MAG: hypothetical protein J7M25_04420 [Deltaproteobacteria bacterium]|nr:hypothetical protein [Deltaproteobacteria bacterium]